MSDIEKLGEIRNAMLLLGYPRDIVIVTMELDQDREVVLVEGDVFGIYDFQKHTFID